MTIKELIVNEIQKVPETMLEEVLDFIRFLELKMLGRVVTQSATLPRSLTLLPCKQTSAAWLGVLYPKILRG